MAIKNQTHISTPADGDMRTPDTSSNTQRTLLLIIGDAIVFLIFAFVGITSHREAVDSVKVVTTAAPFALGWFIVAPFIGAFSRQKTAEPKKMLFYTILAWIPSLALGMTFRGITVEHDVPKLSFIIVTLIANTIFLLIWRLPFAWLMGKKK